jgi:hypothetical protein
MKKSGLWETMPNAPFEMALWTAVAMMEGLVSSSMMRGTSLCPFTPPSAFCKSIRAVKPAGDDASSDAPGPVRELMYAMVIGAGEAEACPVVTPNVMSDANMAVVSKTLLIVRFTCIFPP